MKGTITLFLSTLLLFQYAYSQELPCKDTIMAKMELANTYFMDKWSDPGANIVTDKTRPSNIWTRATYFEGLMALYYVSENTDLYNYAVEWGESHSWEPAYGSLATRDGDNQCCGQTYIELYQIDNQSERITPIKTCIDAMVDSDESDDWSWIDAIQMAMPVFAKLGVVYSDTAYFEKMYDIYNYTKTQHGDSGLYNAYEHLWWRDDDFDPPYTTDNGLNCYWSRGNGWVFAALTRVLDIIPSDENHYNEYLTTFIEMADKLVEIQREDGFWNVSLVDPNDYGGKELSGTAFFEYGLAWGINNNILQDDKYVEAMITAWNGMQNDALHPDGFLGYVQSTGKQPSDGQPVTYTSVPNFEDYGLGAFLLAGSEVYKYAKNNQVTSIENTLHSKEIQLSISPNPATAQCLISYNLAETTKVSLSVYDITGKNVYCFFNNYTRSKGMNTITWSITDNSGNKLPSGIYLLNLKANNTILKNKLMVR